MPRRARLALAGVPMHIIQRGNNHQACFFADDDYRLFRAWLAECAEKNGCDIHAYVLMTNHVHLLLTPQQAEGPGRLMKALGQRYVQHVNRQCRRTGTLWEGRYRSCPIADDTYFLTCQRYIEMNPVRAGMVTAAADYPWSSYHANANGHPDALIRPHPTYLSLASDPADRQAAYRAMFEGNTEDGKLDDIRRATNGNFALGDRRFADQIAMVIGRRVQPGKPGRPRRNPSLARP